VAIEKIKEQLLKTGPEEVQSFLSKLENAAAMPMFDTENAQDFKVNIHPDKKITPGMFKPSKIVPDQYYAHPLTILALKKNLFMPGEEFEDLEIPYQCAACKTELDVQFWHFCPCCGDKFPF
jgi:hypothetical protein